MLSRILDATLSWNLLTGRGKIRASGGTVRASKDFLCHLIL